MAERRCAVVGLPVAHSLSPAMHRAAYARLDLPWTYEAVEVQPGELAAHVAGLDASWRALSVTAPHKRDALALADDTSTTAERVGAANTLVFSGGRVAAHNTDVPGATAALTSAGVLSLDTVRVLGAGATAASLAHAVVSLGATRLELLARDAGRAAETVAAAESVGLEVTVKAPDAPLLDVVDVLVSTVPEDVAGARAHELVESAATIFDVVYDPWPTRLVSAAQKRGRTAVTGLDLLAHQAALQVELMTGATVEVGLLHDAAVAALA